MRISITFWRVTCLLCLWSLVWVPQAAAQDASQVSISGLSGVTFAPPGTEVQLYFIELTEVAGGLDADLKTTGVGTEEIRFSITDLTAPTGTVAADIAALNFYRSTDAVFDAGDALQKSVVPGALGAQTISFGAPSIPSPDIPDAPASIFFIITASIAPGATLGHAFRFGALLGHIDIEDTPAGPIYTLGTLIAASDANRVVIGTQPPPGTTGRAYLPIPVGLEWVAGLGFFGYGVYGLLRRRRGITS